MNNKITFVELAELMAQATSTSKLVCEVFLRELFATISQTLINGESVKVKGIGEFKITSVKPRKSINVNSGEEMEIARYDKVTFTPDKSLALAVNHSFAQFETVMLADGVTDEKLAEIDKKYPSVFPDEVVPEAPDFPEAPFPTDFPELQNEAPAPQPSAFVAPKADEVKQPAAAKPEPAKAEPVEEPVKPEPAPEPVKVEPIEEPVEEKKPVEPAKAEPVEEPVEEKKPVEEKEDKKEKTAQPERKPMLVGIPIDGPSQPVPDMAPVEDVKPDKRFYRPEPRNAYTPTPEQIEEASHKPNRRWLWLLLAALAAGLLLWFLTRNGGESQAEQPQQEVVAADTITEAEADAIRSHADDKSSEEKAMETKIIEETNRKSGITDDKDAKQGKTDKADKTEKPVTADKPATAKKPVVTDVVTSQIVLTTLSEKYYGSPWFWVYIYEENMNIISNPNNIKPGTRVVIPPAEKYGINAKDKASLKKAQLKSWQYLKDK